MHSGLFIISLDFELHWGIFDVLGDEYKDNLIGARKAIPEILKQFDKFNIHATWATVGLLFANSKDEIKEWAPKEINYPTYVNRNYCAYRVTVEKDEETDPIHFAKSLIKEIKSVRGQEIGTHTFSHYYCLEDGQTVGQFEADIKAALIAAKKLEVELNSIVFPRNQVNKKYLKILKRNGFKCFRGAESGKIYKANDTKNYNRLYYKGLRFADSYFSITGYDTYGLESLTNQNDILNIPGSRFLRPYNPLLSFLEPLKLRRIKKSMEYAAKNNQIYHLWWHPHNFGSNKDENISSLKQILSFYCLLSKKHGMQSVNMNEIFQMNKAIK